MRNCHVVEKMPCLEMYTVYKSTLIVGIPVHCVETYCYSICFAGELLHVFSLPESCVVCCLSYHPSLHLLAVSSLIHLVTLSPFSHINNQQDTKSVSMSSLSLSYVSRR